MTNPMDVGGVGDTDSSQAVVDDADVYKAEIALL